MNKIVTIIKDLNKVGVNPVKSNNALKWCKGNREACKNLFIEIFKAVDNTISDFQYLEEYDEIVDWMTDTKGKGLLLTGGCGRGKSIIATGVIPVLLKMATNCAVRAVHAEHLDRPCTPTIEGMPNKPINIDYLCAVSYPIIDDIGVEVQIGGSGEKYEGVNRVINVAEQQAKAVFVTTNLNGEQIMERYGMRTVDRLAHLCKIVKFKHNDSLRK